MNRSVTLVFPNQFSTPAYSPALGALSSVLKQNGIPVQLVHIHPDMGLDDDPEGVAHIIIEYGSGIAAFTATELEYDYVDTVAKILKRKQFNGLLVLGGPFATLCPDEFRKSAFDVWCRGEGELSLLELLKDEESKHINNLYFKQDGRIIKNKMRCNADLNQYPIPDREVFDMSRLLPLKSGWIDILTEKGCPFACPHCCNHAFNEIYFKDTGCEANYRKKSVDKIIDEIKYLIRLYGDLIKVVNFHDDLFSFDKKWLNNFCSRYKREIGIPFSINARIGMIDERDIKVLKDANCQELRFGLESGSPFILQKILNRNISNDQVIEIFSIAKKYQINTFAFCMIGIPGEHRNHVLQTIKLLAAIKPRLIRCSIFYPFRGTRLYDYCKDKSYLKKKYKKPSSYFEDSVLQMDVLPREEILKFHRFFGWYINAELHNNLSERVIKKIESSRLVDLDEVPAIEESLASIQGTQDPFYCMMGEGSSYYWRLRED